MAAAAYDPSNDGWNDYDIHHEHEAPAAARAAYTSARPVMAAAQQQAGLTPIEGAAAEGIGAVAGAAGQPAGSTQSVLNALARGGAAGAAGPGSAPADAHEHVRRRLQQAPSAAKGAGNTPGLFMGGPTLTPQHAGAAADSPEKGAASEVAARQQSGDGSLDPYLVRSLTNNMMFAVK